MVHVELVPVERRSEVVNTHIAKLLGGSILEPLKQLAGKCHFNTGGEPHDDHVICVAIADIKSSRSDGIVVARLCESGLKLGLGGPNGVTDLLAHCPCIRIQASTIAS